MEKEEKIAFNDLPKIIAVDFDGTLVKDNFPDIGKPNQELFDLMKKLKTSGVKLILWTSRNAIPMLNRNLEQEAVDFCKSLGLEFDAVNENIKEVKELTGGDTRKVYADLYIDDKAIPHMTHPLYWLDKLGLRYFDFYKNRFR